MRKSLTPYQIELLNFVTEETKRGNSLKQAFNKFASMKKSSFSKVQGDWYTCNSGIVRRTFNVEQGIVEKSIPKRRKRNYNKYSKEQLDKAIELKKTHTYAEVEKMTGVKKSTLTTYISRRGKAQPINATVNTKTHTEPSAKKKTVKASQLLSSIDSIKSDLNENMIAIHSDLISQISHVKQSLQSEINGIVNILKMQHHLLEGSKEGRRYLVDANSNVKYIGDPMVSSDSGKVNKLMSIVDELERQVKSKEDVLEDRRQENSRLVKRNEILKETESSLLNQVDKKDKELERLKKQLSLLQEENNGLKSRGMFKRLLNA